MFVMANFLETVASVLNTALSIYSWAIIIRVLVTWFSPDPFNPLMQFLMRICDPFLDIFRRTIPPLGPFDLSPMIALLVLQAAQHFLVKTLFDFSIRMR
jgi:YggT family protein